MDPHLDLVASVGIDLPEFVHEVQPRPLGRHVQHFVARVHLVLDELVRTVGVNDRIAFLLVFAEIVLARRTDILDTGFRDDAPVVVMADEHLVESLEKVYGQFVVGRLGQSPVDAFMDVQVVQPFGVETHPL